MQTQFETSVCLLGQLYVNDNIIFLVGNSDNNLIFTLHSVLSWWSGYQDKLNVEENVSYMYESWRLFYTCTSRYESHYMLPLSRKKGAKLTEAEEAVLNKKLSNKTQKKYEERKKIAKVM